MKNAVIALIGPDMPESFSSVLFSKPESVLETTVVMTRLIKYLLNQRQTPYRNVGRALYGRVKGIIGNCWVAPLYDGRETHYAVFEDDSRAFYVVHVPVSVDLVNAGQTLTSHKITGWQGRTIYDQEHEVAVEWSVA